MKVVIIGTGNTAFVLGRKIQKGGDEIIQVVGRNLEQAHALAGTLRCDVVYNPRYIKTYADVYLLAVADRAIEDVAGHLRLGDKTVVHTAASVSREAVSKSSSNYGVVYPLQSLRKETTELPEIPVLIAGNNNDTRKQLFDFCMHWADKVEVAEDEERLKVHTAAVLSNNFINHLLTLTEKFCRQEHLNFRLLLPLLQETVKRLELHSPARLQTGPAARGDYYTIEKHQEILSKYPDLKNLYDLFTASIMKEAGKPLHTATEV